jgi:hypothetical protein
MVASASSGEPTSWDIHDCSAFSVNGNAAGSSPDVLGVCGSAAASSPAQRERQRGSKLARRGKHGQATHGVIWLP